MIQADSPQSTGGVVPRLDWYGLKPPPGSVCAPGCGCPRWPERVPTYEESSCRDRECRAAADGVDGPGAEFFGQRPCDEPAWRGRGGCGSVAGSATLSH